MLLKTEADDLQNYLTDASNILGGHARKVILPESVEEVAEALREANATKSPVTVSGARTGTVGGAVPFGGAVISLERLNKFGGISQKTMTAVAEAGVILADLQREANGAGLFYPPDPTEWSCQIGGTIATNASGARSFKYGATRGYVDSLKVVLADGDSIDLTRGKILANDNGVVSISTLSGREITCRAPTYPRPNVRKNVSGYFNAQPLDAIDLFIGSEGTLGIITSAQLALLPKPQGFFSGIVFFKKNEDLLGFVEEARSVSISSRCGSMNSSINGGGSKPDAALIEYFDGRALAFIREVFPETPEGMAGAIFFEQETDPENEDTLFEAWNELLEKTGADLARSWFTTTEPDRDRMRAFRHALPVAVNERIVRYGQRKVGTDMSVPDDRFPAFLRFYNDILGDSGLDYVIFGHIGDNHLHANMLPKNEAEAENARHIYGRCVAQAIMLGGVVSAEHGIGKLKRKYLSAMMGERYLNEMAELKRAFDPNGILGRGNMFDESYLN
jgi:D-lactate dehydrogenase (cytochrome)